MSEKIIPQQKQITCDVCQRLCEPHGPARRSMDGFLNLIAHGEWAPEGFNMHLCDPCVHEAKRVLLALKVKP